VAAPADFPMLAASGGGTLRGEWAAEPKLDGWRAIVTVDPSLSVGIEDLLDACARLQQEGIVLKRVDAPYTPGVRTDVWRKVKTTGWRTTHAPRRLPKELRERIYG
jgi:ATP-dependent DNA ligase